MTVHVSEQIEQIEQIDGTIKSVKSEYDIVSNGFENGNINYLK